MGQQPQDGTWYNCNNSLYASSHDMRVSFLKPASIKSLCKYETLKPQHWWKAHVNMKLWSQNIDEKACVNMNLGTSQEKNSTESLCLIDSSKNVYRDKWINKQMYMNKQTNVHHSEKTTSNFNLPTLLWPWTNESRLVWTGRTQYRLSSYKIWKISFTLCPRKHSC